MDDVGTHSNLSMEDRKKEAEVYYSMGLLSEALELYERLAADFPDIEISQKQTLLEKIETIREEIEVQNKEDVEQLTSEDISLIKETISSEEDLESIYGSAVAFKELGLFQEAAPEFEKLVGSGYAPEKYTPEWIDSLLQFTSAVDVMQKTKKTILTMNAEDSSKSELLSLVAQEMEKWQYRDLAYDIYREASRLNPHENGIKESLSRIQATFASGSKYDYLINKNLVNTEQLKKALTMGKKMNKSIETILIEQFKIPKEEIGKSLSLYFGCPFKSYDPACKIQPELLTNLKKTFLLQDLWLPLSWDRDGVEILIDDPKNLAKTDNIKALIRSKIKFSIGIREDIEAFIRDCFDSTQKKEDEAHGFKEEEFEMLPDISFEEYDDVEDEDYEDIDEASGQVVKLVDQILVSAYRKSASDIHIEPSIVTKATMVRFRMDGVCQEYIQVPNSLARGILSRLKIMSGLDIAERRLPQDGKIKFKRKGIEAFELRLATLPTTGGYEDAVMRILAKAGAMPLEKAGLLERNYEVLSRLIKQPYGLVLVVGPTGSGKTTSLHAALGAINKPGVKIWTAEDPVEITQNGLRQVEAKPKIGLDFARIMRAFLRADPDVIMIGEMRDYETASIGVEASLTGHLVFSTLHTNSAPETITRLLDMGLNPLNFSDAFLGVMAQRLARRLCSECKEAYHPTREEFEEIVQDYGEEWFAKTGLKYTEDLKLFHPVGCEACSGVGYKGRLGIHELMEGTSEIKRMIKKQAPTDDLFQQAMTEGMTTLKQDGLIKVFQGLTDVSEIRRIIVS